MHRCIAASHRLEAERVVEFNGRLIVGLNVQVNLNDIIRVLLDLREEWSLRSRLGKPRLLSFRRPFRRLVVTDGRGAWCVHGVECSHIAHHLPKRGGGGDYDHIPAPSSDKKRFTEIDILA